MKVLYIGHYRERSGWGDGCIATIKTLLTIPGIDLVCRPILMGQDNPNIPEEVLECESKDSRGCDYCIQQILPHLMEYNGNFKKCIGYYYGETNNTQYASWPAKLNLMDEIWHPNNQQLRDCRSSGVNSPSMAVVPYACDIEKYMRSYEPLDIPQIAGNFVFYFIGENNRRKNIPALVKAFHMEFSTSEPVSLIIKTSMPGHTPEQTHKIIDDTCRQIKTSLKMYSKIEEYKSELVIPYHYTEEEIMSLHSMCDCFVMPSCGESVCIPAFDAMAMGKTPICNAVGGMLDFIMDDFKFGGLLVDNRETPVTDMNNTFQDLLTGRETWREIDVLNLRDKMRTIYQMHELREELSNNGLLLASEYTYENIGLKIKGLLES